MWIRSGLLSILALVTVTAAFETKAPALAGPGAPSTNATVQDISQVCSALAQKLGYDKVRQQSFLDLQYVQSVQHSWNQQQSYYKPACVIYPKETNDIALTYQAITQNNIPYGVKSGSHGVAYGWCATPGVLIDLVKMDNVEYVAERGVAILGPGNRWGRVYDILAEQGQTVIGGRVTDVGMGLLLNGGVSYISGDYGFASTNFVELEVVLPAGEVVVATPTNQYKDLLWAMQASGNAFGIVTQYTVKAYPLENQFWGGLIIYGADQLDAASDAAIDFLNDVTDPKAAIVPTFEIIGLPLGALVQPIAIFALSYAGPTPPANMFDRLLNIPHISADVKTRPYAGPGGIVHLFDGFGSIYGDAQSFRVQGHKITKDIGRLAIAAARNITQVHAGEVDTFSVSFEHIFAQTIAISNQSPLGGIPYGFEEKPLTYVLYNVAYKAELPTDRKQRLLQTFNENVDSVPSTGKFPLYLPYSAPDQRALQTYNNYDRLKAIKKKYDPQNLVQRLAGGPKFD
ncbi:hypothetical protein CF319_g4736 [Tilletia indica]|nr:hypothetical protein CF319_g4736 [Tilletia indica]